MGFGASGMPGRRWMPAGFVQSPLGGCRRRSRRYLIGTMIEVPRGAVTADEIAKEAEFFSFVTLDASGVGLLVEIGVKKGRRVVLPVPSADRRLAAAQAQLGSKASD